MTEYRKRKTRQVKYGGSDAAILRSVLYDLWKARCYWCGQIKDFADIKTDHIIPRELCGKQLTEALDRVGRPHAFDRDDPENLAPICEYCNGPARKGSQDLTHLPAVSEHLEKARRRRSEVVRRVLAFSNRHRLGQAFLTLKSADLDDEQTVEAFKAGMPAVVRMVSAHGGELADLPFVRVLSAEIDDGEPITIPVEFDGDAKRAAQLLEGLTGASLEEAVQEPLAKLWELVLKHVHASFEGLDGDGLGPCISGPPVALYIRIDIEDLSFERHGGSFEFKLEGSFDAHLSASLVRDDPYAFESDTVDIQGDATVEGTFDFAAHWDTEDGDLYADEPVIDFGPEEYWTSA